MTAFLARLEAELRNDPALAAEVDLILSRPDVFPPLRPKPKLVPIRCDEVSVHRAIARAARLAVNGIESQINLVTP